MFPGGLCSTRFQVALKQIYSNRFIEVANVALLQFLVHSMTTFIMDHTTFVWHEFNYISNNI